MKKNIQKIFLVALSVFMFSACEKEAENIFTMFDDVTVTFNNSDPRCVTDTKVVNDKEEVWIDFTINSANEDIASVILEKSAGNGFERETLTAPTSAQRRSYSFIKKIIMGRDGATSYRVYALNAKGVYIGDGYKKVTIEQNVSYTVLSNRVIALPDTAAKILPSFFSISEGASYSYTNGKANSAKIDFGIYRKLDPAKPVTDQSYAVNLYSISTPTSPLTVYDVSTWDKRTTKFSAPITGQGTVFLTGAVSGSTIETLAKARTINLNATVATTAAAGLATGSAVFFLTPEGKYGMLYINNVTSDFSKIPIVSVSVKMQK
jgi:hypothetical protein